MPSPVSQQLLRRTGRTLQSCSRCDIRRYSVALPPPAPSIAHLPGRSVLEISGPDAQKFLKGVTCRDVEKLKGGYSGFLNASGRVLHTVFIIPKQGAKVPTYLITHEESPDHPAPLLSFLPPFKLRSKVKIRNVSEEWDVWNAWGSEGIAGPSRRFKFGSGGAAEAQWAWDGEVGDLGLRAEEIGCWDLRAGWGSGGLGRRVLVPKGSDPSLMGQHDTVKDAEYDLRRMMLGVPEGAAEIVPGTALPLESCMDIQGGVDFRKGCYLGQELTVRTYHTGATRKRILPIHLISPTSSSPSSPGTPSDGPQLPSEAMTGGIDITFHPPESSATKKPRSAGKLLSLHDSVTSVGLGLVRLEMVEKSAWSTGGDEDRGRLSVSLNGQEWGVEVGKGEAYGASLRQLEEQAQEQ